MHLPQRNYQDARFHKESRSIYKSKILRLCGLAFAALPACRQALREMHFRMHVVELPNLKSSIYNLKSLILNGLSRIYHSSFQNLKADGYGCNH